MLFACFLFVLLHYFPHLYSGIVLAIRVRKGYMLTFDGWCWIALVSS